MRSVILFNTTGSIHAFFVYLFISFNFVVDFRFWSLSMDYCAKVLAKTKAVQNAKLMQSRLPNAIDNFEILRVYSEKNRNDRLQWTSIRDDELRKKTTLAFPISYFRKIRFVLLVTSRMTRLTKTRGNTLRA